MGMSRLPDWDQTTGPTSNKSEADALEAAKLLVEINGGEDKAFVMHSKSNGESMQPWIPENCYLVMEKVSRVEVKVGDIIRFYGKPKPKYEERGVVSRIVLHRVVGISQDGGEIRTKGENPVTNSKPDNHLTVAEVHDRVTDIVYFDPSKTMSKEERDKVLYE